MPRQRDATPGTLRTEIGPFVIVPAWVLDRCAGNSRAVHLYSVLARFANKDGKAWPSRSQLRGALDTSASTVDRAIADLKDIGALEVHLRHRHDGAVLGADYMVVQAQRECRDLIVTDDKKEPATLFVIRDEKVPVPFRQNSTAFSSPVTTVLKEELDPSNQIQEHEERKAPPAARPKPGEVFTQRLDAMNPDEGLLCDWNELVDAPPFRRVMTITAKRRRSVRAALASHPRDVWRGIFARVNESAFCRGSKGWVASFDWLVKSPDNAVRVLEGHYDDITPSRPRDVGAMSHAFECPHDPPCTGRNNCDVKQRIAEARESAPRQAQAS